MNIAPAQSFEAVAEFPTGLTGTLGVRVTDNQGATTIARVTAGIAEYPAASGVYAYTFTAAPSVAGQYSILWDDGAGNYAQEDLVVTYTPVPGATGSLYITTAEMKTALSIGTQSYADTDIDRACAAVSRAIDEATRPGGSHFYQATETRLYTPDDFNCTLYYGSYGAEHRLEIEDLVSASSVTVDTGGDGSYSTTWVEGTDFFLDPANATTDGKPHEEIVLRARGGRYFPRIQRAVKVTGTFGWPAVPVQVSQYAVFFASQTILRSRQAPFGILMQGMEVGAVARIMRFDPDFDRFLGPFTRTKLFI